MAKENLNELIVGMHNREVERIREEQKKEEEQRQEQDQQRRKKTKGALSLFEQVTNPVLPEEKIFQAARKAELTRAQREEQQAAQQLEDYKQSGRRSADWDKAVSDAMAAINPGMGNLDLQLMQAASNTRNQTEDYYQAVADYFARNRQATEDRHLMENDVADVEAMSAEDRKLLETYAYGRSEWMDPKKVADSTAARAELEKKYGAKRVEELAESWQRHQNQLLAERNRQETQEQAGNGFFAGVGHSAASVAANALGSLSAPLGYLQEAMGRTGRYQTLDPNNPGALPGQYASAVRETVSEDMGGVGKVLYHGTMGAADNLARIAMAAGSGPLALGLAAVGSFGSTVSEASSRGATPGQAVLLGVANAGIEVATEKIGLDELFRAGKSGYKGAKAAFMQALRQGGIEAAEEELSFLGNILTDAAVMQEKSAYNQQIGELVANGMSYADAKNQADRALWDEAVNTAFTSFVSGGVMSGVQSGGQYVRQKIQERNATRNATVPENATVSKAETVGAENAAVSRMETTAPAPERVPQESAAKDGMALVMEAAREVMGVDKAQADTLQGNAMGRGSDSADTNAISNPVESYPAEKQRSIRSYIQSADENIRSFVRRVKSGDLSFKRLKISNVSQRAAGDISKILGIDVSGYTNNINTNGVQHILNRHGETGEQDHSMAQDADIARIGWVLENYDRVELLADHGEQIYSGEFLDRNHNPAPQIKFVKKIDGSYYVVEAAFENKYKKLWVQSAYLQKNGDVTQTPAEDPSANHETNARSAFASPSPDYRVTKNGGNVNGGNVLQGLPDGVEDSSGPGASGLEHGSVGADTHKFKNEVRKSKVYENTYKYATDPELKAAGKLAQELDPRIGEYDYISEEESLANAEMRTRDAQNRWAEYHDLVTKQEWTGEDNDTAFRLLKHFQKNGQTEQFKILARAQKEQATSQGQFVQSFAKYSRDATKAAVDAVEKLGKLSKGDVPKKFWGKSESFEAWKDDILKSVMEIANDVEAVEDGNAEDMRKIVRQLANFRKTTAFFGMSSNLTKNAERILKKMDFNTAKDIACAQLGKIPDDFRRRSVGEVVNAIRYQNMLSSLVTVDRNLAGNGTMGMVDAFSDATAGQFADLLLSKVTGKRTVGNDIRYAKTYLNAARDAADMASLLAELDIPAEHEGKYTGRTRTFSPQGGPLSRFLSAYEKYMNYALQVSDEFFSGGTAGAVSKSLEALGAKSGLTDKEIAALSDWAGRRRTFKEGRKLAKASGKMKAALNEIGTEGFGAGDVLLAFAETPAEMGQVAIDYSGTGILEGFAEMASIIKDARNGKAIDAERQRKAVSDFGRGVTGVGLIALFTALAAKGLIAVHDDEDKDKRGLEQSLGLSGAQFNLSATVRAMRGESTEWKYKDLTMSIDFLQPLNSQMYIGYLLSQEEEVGLKEYAGASIQGIAQSVLDIPMMGTIEDIADLMTSFGEVSEGDFSAVTDAAGQLIGNQASSFIPAWMRQTAQYIDRVYRDTTGENALDAAKNRVMSGIPFLSQQLPAKYDGLGNLQTRYDNKLMGFFNTFINAGALTRIQTSDIADKLEELGDKSLYPEYLAPKSFKVDGETVMVSGKEMTETYQKTYGDNVTALYGGLMESADFQKLSKEQQVAALKQAKTYATQLAKAAVSNFKDIPEGTAEELTRGIIQKQVEKALSGSFDDLTKAWKNGKEDTELAEGLEAAYQAFSGLSEEARAAAMEQLPQKVKDYIGAREAGQDAADYLKVQKAVTQADHYMDQMAEALKKGGTGEEHFDALDQLYESYAKMDYNDREAVKEKASSKVKYFLEARAAGVPTQTFSGLYNEFNRIQGAEDVTASDKATQWAHALQKAREAGRITQTQADKLREAMGMWQVIPAKADAYADLTREGLSADDADNLLRILDQIQGTGKLDEETGQRVITDLDRLQGIAGASFLTSQERDAAMKLYMPDYDPKDESPNKTELKYDYARKELGLTAAEYVAAYRAHVENSRKQAKMDAWEELGFTAQEAAMLWRLFGASGSAKIDVEAWYNEK